MTLTIPIMSLKKNAKRKLILFNQHEKSKERQPNQCWRATCSLRHVARFLKLKERTQCLISDHNRNLSHNHNLPPRIQCCRTISPIHHSLHPSLFIGNLQIRHALRLGSIRPLSHQIIPPSGHQKRQWTKTPISHRHNSSQQELTHKALTLQEPCHISRWGWLIQICDHKAAELGRPIYHVLQTWLVACP